MTDGRNEKAREEMKKKMRPAVKEAAKAEIMQVLSKHGLSIVEAKEVTAMVDTQILLAHTDNTLKSLIQNTFKTATMKPEDLANDNNSEMPKMPPKPESAAENKKADGSK